MLQSNLQAVKENLSRFMRTKRTGSACRHSFPQWSIVSYEGISGNFQLLLRGGGKPFATRWFRSLPSWYQDSDPWAGKQPRAFRNGVQNWSDSLSNPSQTTGATIRSSTVKAQSTIRKGFKMGCWIAFALCSSKVNPQVRPTEYEGYLHAIAYWRYSLSRTTQSPTIETRDLTTGKANLSVKTPQYCSLTNEDSNSPLNHRGDRAGRLSHHHHNHRRTDFGGTSYHRTPTSLQRTHPNDQEFVGLRPTKA